MVIVFKNLIILALFIGGASAFGQQTFPSDHINLFSIIDPNKDSISLYEFKYSGCWGWFQESKKKEYAIVGSRSGVYFIDITDPYKPKVCSYIIGRGVAMGREVKTYKNYCYVTCNGGSGISGLQIIDMKYLPDSTHIVSSGIDFLKSSHTIWVDGNKMYAGSVNLAQTETSGMCVFSLKDPENPFLLRNVNQDFTYVYAHDMYAKNDTVYVNDPGRGLHVLKFDTILNRFQMLGSYSGYNKQGYNHSSFLTQNSKYLVFCDEIPAGVPIHLVDVSNLSNIQPITEFIPYPLTTPHNPYILGNEWAIISCYEDGLHIYDISNPYKVKKAGFFDTNNQSGFLQGAYINGYSGNWGAYPFLPSKTIIATDGKNGIFLLDASEIYNQRKDSVVKEISVIPDCASLFTNPTSKKIILNIKGHSGIFELKTLDGKHILKGICDKNEVVINTESLPNGVYLFTFIAEDCAYSKKITITHFD